MCLTIQVSRSSKRSTSVNSSTMMIDRLVGFSSANSISSDSCCGSGLPRLVKWSAWIKMVSQDKDRNISVKVKEDKPN